MRRYSGSNSASPNSPTCREKPPHDRAHGRKRRLRAPLRNPPPRRPPHHRPRLHLLPHPKTGTTSANKPTNSTGGAGRKGETANRHGNTSAPTTSPRASPTPPSTRRRPNQQRPGPTPHTRRA